MLHWEVVGVPNPTKYQSPNNVASMNSASGSKSEVTNSQTKVQVGHKGYPIWTRTYNCYYWELLSVSNLPGATRLSILNLKSKCKHCKSSYMIQLSQLNLYIRTNRATWVPMACFLREKWPTKTELLVKNEQSRTGSFFPQAVWNPCVLHWGFSLASNAEIQRLEIRIKGIYFRTEILRE